MADVTYTVPNKSGSYDGDMVVKQYTSMIIDSGDTVTVDQPCRGLFILVQGDCTINGTLQMSSKGGFANPTTAGGSDNNAVDSNGLRLPFLTSGGSSSLTASNTLFNGAGNDARNILANFRTLSSNGDIITLVRQGANGGASQSANNVGIAGSNGSTGQTGGGGSGGANYVGNSGAGAYGSCFAGGSGGGSVDNNGSVTGGTNWSGAGGNSATGHGAVGSGGSGNPQGSDTNTAGDGIFTPDAEFGQGVGGLIILVVKGNLTVGSSGKILARGGSRHCSRNGTGQWIASGGAGGGGNIVLAYKGTYTNNGTVSADGGRSPRVHNTHSITGWNNGTSTATDTYSMEGGAGGNGSVQTLQII
tara:strand:+ start:1689 stop:2768 length:1080 start_codon:yes stop_codon:yes gene_type:complete